MNAAHDQSHDSLPEPSREELLISRIVDGEAFEDDWREFEALASDDPRIWERLARAQRQHDRLTRNVSDAIAIAELVDIPRAGVHSFALAARLRQYSGWAVAAIVSLALMTVLGVRIAGQSAGGMNQSAILATTPADELREEYVRRGIDEGLVVSEAPNILVRARVNSTEPGYEVVFVRQIIERRTLSDLQMLQQFRDPATGETRQIQMPIRRVAGRAY